MTDDIIKRVEAALEEVRRHPARPFAAEGHSWVASVWRAIDLVPELIAELKDARAEVEHLKKST